MIRPGNLPDCIGALVFLGIGFLVLREAQRLQAYASSVYVGDHTFPGILGILFVVLGALLLIQSWGLRRGAKTAASPALTAATSRVRLLLCLAVLFLYAVLITAAGYVLATFLTSLALFRLIGGYRWLVSISCAVVLTGCQYILFIYWLQIPLSNGSLL